MESSQTYISRYQTFIQMYILYTSLIGRMSSCTLIYNKVFVLSYFVFTKTTPLSISSREDKAYLYFSSFQTRTIFMHFFSIFPCILIFSEKKRQNFQKFSNANLIPPGNSVIGLQFNEMYGMRQSHKCKMSGFGSEQEI